MVLAAYRDNNGNNSRVALVDSMQITVYYELTTTTSVDCGGGASVTYGDSISCVATVSGSAGALTPSGTVSWTTGGSGAFDPNPCTLSGAGGVATCTATYTPSAVGTGSHLVAATYNSDNNFTSSNASQTITVNQRPVTVTADAQTKAYGDADPTLTYQITSGSLVFGDTFSGILYRVAGEDVGTYPINMGTLALSSNYTLTFVVADLTSTPRPIEVTADAQTKVYGEADPTLTYQVTGGSLVTGDEFSGILTRLPGENVGTYAILQGTLALSANYELAYVGADLTITPRPIEVTADAKTKLYGDADPTLTYQITPGSLVFGDAFSGILYRAAGENVGAYPINLGTLALPSNYTLTLVVADVTITPRPIEVTADAQTKAYGDPDPTLTYQITSGSLVFGDTFSGRLYRAAGEDIGPYPINQSSLVLSSNYTLTFVVADLTITPRPIKVTADAKGKIIKHPDPVLTFKITSGSLLVGDAFSGMLTQQAGEDAGVYAILQGTLLLPSYYEITFVGADFTIFTSGTFIPLIYL